MSQIDLKQIEVTRSKLNSIISELFRCQKYLHRVLNYQRINTISSNQRLIVESLQNRANSEIKMVEFEIVKLETLYNTNSIYTVDLQKFYLNLDSIISQTEEVYKQNVNGINEDSSFIKGNSTNRNNSNRNNSSRINNSLLLNNEKQNDSSLSKNENRIERKLDLFSSREHENSIIELNESLYDKGRNQSRINSARMETPVVNNSKFRSFYDNINESSFNKELQSTLNTSHYRNLLSNNHLNNTQTKESMIHEQETNTQNKIIEKLSKSVNEVENKISKLSQQMQAVTADVNNINQNINKLNSEMRDAVKQDDKPSIALEYYLNRNNLNKLDLDKLSDSIRDSVFVIEQLKNLIRSVQKESKQVHIKNEINHAYKDQSDTSTRFKNRQFEEIKIFDEVKPDSPTNNDINENSFENKNVYKELRKRDSSQILSRSKYLTSFLNLKDQNI